MPKPVVLIVDDDEQDRLFASRWIHKEAEGEFQILEAKDPAEGLKLVAARKPDLILLDYAMPIMHGFDFLEHLKRDRVPTRVIFLSSKDDDGMATEAIRRGACDWVTKPISYKDWSGIANKVKRALLREPTLDRTPLYVDVSRLDRAVSEADELRAEITSLRRENQKLKQMRSSSKARSSGTPKVFIVHGQNEVMKLQLKNYLQNTLKIGEPIILHEQPSQGRTIIEKFESHANRADIAFILLTPDDKVATGDEDNKARRRARQNVIFEMGYFFARLKRTSGKVILLTQGKLDLPSDTSGMIYIDISDGIDAAGEEIRKELDY